MLCVCILAALLAVIHAACPCNFASLFTISDLLQSDLSQQDFVQCVFQWEANWQADDVGYDATTGMTFDGRIFNLTTGLLQGPAWSFSAASKESLHVAVLARAVGGNPLAQEIYSVEKAVSILTTKIASMEAWNATYPGFGGFLPWFQNCNDSITLLSGWTNRTPALDNGEMLWAMYGAAAILNQNGYAELGARYRNWVDWMSSTVKTMFWDPVNNGLACVVIVGDVNLPVFDPKQSYEPDGNCLLNDPYEGELMSVFAELYGGLTQEEADAMWIGKRPKLQAVNYFSPTFGNITVERGWWFSAHEKWKYMFLPYFDSPINTRVFLNGERARTVNSAENSIPGLYASVTNITTVGANGPDGYISDLGIQSIAFEAVDDTIVVTAYAAFPVILAAQLLNTTHAKGVALSWMLNVMQAPKGQGPYGSTESVDVAGGFVCAASTWDAKVNQLVALMGGVIDVNRQQLASEGKLATFVNRINTEWGRVFTDLQGEAVELQPPSVTVPASIPGFSACGSTTTL